MQNIRDPIEEQVDKKQKHIVKVQVIAASVKIV